MTQKEAARRRRISYPRMNEIIHGKRTVVLLPWSLGPSRARNVGAATSAWNDATDRVALGHPN